MYSPDISEMATVADLAISHPGALSILMRYNIDYCCGGHRTLHDACTKIGLDPAVVREEIRQRTPQDQDLAFRPERWPSTLLADYIVGNHHTYVKEAVPELEALLDRVCERHGHEHDELLQIREHFRALAEELIHHMEKEELVLFPAIRRLESHDRGVHPMERMIQAPIQAMEHEHDDAGRLIHIIRSLTHHYQPPAEACTTYRVTFQKLKEFEQDLMQHIHLENNILFRRYKKQEPAS